MVGLPWPPPGDLPGLGMEPEVSCICGRVLPTEPPQPLLEGTQEGFENLTPVDWTGELKQLPAQTAWVGGQPFKAFLYNVKQGQATCLTLSLTLTPGPSTQVGSAHELKGQLLTWPKKKKKPRT